MLIPAGQTPGLKEGYVLVYCGGLHTVNEGSIHPLLGVPVKGIPPIGVGLPIKTAYRPAQKGGGEKTVVKATRCAEGVVIAEDLWYQFVERSHRGWSLENVS